MTNAELIAKIKAEIERKRSYNQRNASPEGAGAFYEDERFLSFLDILESEKPMNQDGMEEEIEMEWDSFSKHLAEYDNDDSDEVIWLNKFSFTDIARRFAKWGAEHLKK